MKRVLFISHDAYCAGATLLFLQLLEHVRKSGSIEMEILIKSSHGRLLPEFKKMAPTHIWSHKISPKNKLYSFLSGQIDKIRQRVIKRHLHSCHFDLIYSNTITNGELLASLSSLRLPVITQVHELGYWIDRCGPRNLELVKAHTDLFLAASRAVKAHLVQQHSVNEERIKLAYEYTDTVRVLNTQRPGDLKQRLGLPAEAILVAACGDEVWRKGKDLFVPVASRVLRNTNLPVHFVWIGGKISKEIAFDLHQSGFRDRIHFIDFIPEANRYFCDIEIFAMLSRDDPFPVVNLEAGTLGKPIVCFANSGGTPELIEEFSANIIPYLDLGAMSDRILELIEMPCHERQAMGASLASKVAKNFDINIGTQHILNIILQGV